MARRSDHRRRKGQGCPAGRGRNHLGGSALYGINALRAAGARADRVVTVVDREQGAEAMLAEQGVRIFPLVRVQRTLKRVRNFYSQRTLGWYMKILVVGGGGREHAIAAALARNTTTEVFSVMAKRNPGIDAIAREVLLCKGDRDVPRSSPLQRRSVPISHSSAPKPPSRPGSWMRSKQEGIPCVGPATGRGPDRDGQGILPGHDGRRMPFAGCPKYRVFHSAR